MVRLTDRSDMTLDVTKDVKNQQHKHNNNNEAKAFQREINVKGQMLVTVISFKYLEVAVSDSGSKPAVLSRIISHWITRDNQRD